MRHDTRRDARHRLRRGRPRWLAAGERGTSIVDECRDELRLIVARRSV